MAYQNVGTPRFYVNIPEWIASTGVALDQPHQEHLRTLPVNFWNTDDLHANQDHRIMLPTMQGMTENGFIAILGHKMRTSIVGETSVYCYLREGESVVGGFISIINGGTSSYGIKNPDYDGFSISKFNGTDTFTSFWASFLIGELGSIVIGTYYDMPNAPNLSLNMSRDYGGTKEFTTYNGSSMSNTMWSKPPKWGDLGAWELGSGNPVLSRSGRRSWDLKFSYMDDGDLWGSNQSLSYISENTSAQNTAIGYESGDVSSDNLFDFNLLTDDNFFSQVWHKTLGGTLPFIFQPDGGANGNNNPDQFCIAKFKDNSLKATQSAYNVYDISLSIEEVW